MKNRIIFEIAWHNMALYRLRSVLTILGFAIGSGAIMFLLGFGYGLERLVTSQVSGADAYLMLDTAPVNQAVAPLNDNILQMMSGIGGVSAVAPEADLSARAAYQDKTVDLALIAVTKEFFDWRNIATVAEAKGDATGGGVAINTALAATLTGDKPQTLLGKEITLDIITPKELTASGESIATSGQVYRVAKVVKEDGAPKIYGDTELAKSLGVANYTQARVRVTDKEKVADVRSRIENAGFKTNYIGDTVDQINDVFRVFKSILGSLGAIALAIAIIGMFNTLTISLMERVKEIALMKVLGMKRKVVTKIIIAEALIIGALGAAVGVVLGLMAGVTVNAVISSYARRAGGEAVSVFYFPLGLILGTVFGAMVITVLTSLLPVRRANRVNPLHVFRYE